MPPVTASLPRLSVRPLRGDDHAALVAIRNAMSVDDIATGTTARPPMAPRPLTPDAFGAVTESGLSFVAEADGRIIGYLLAEPIAYDDDRPLTVWVEEVAVNPDQRRRRVATLLYRTFAAAATASGVRAVVTRIAADDAAAVALHRRVGYEPHGTGALVWRLEVE